MVYYILRKSCHVALPLIEQFIHVELLPGNIWLSKERIYLPEPVASVKAGGIELQQCVICLRCKSIEMLLTIDNGDRAVDCRIFHIQPNGLFQQSTGAIDILMRIGGVH